MHTKFQYLLPITENPMILALQSPYKKESSTGIPIWMKITFFLLGFGGHWNKVIAFEL